MVVKKSSNELATGFRFCNNIPVNRERYWGCRVPGFQGNYIADTRPDFTQIIRVAIEVSGIMIRFTLSTESNYQISVRLKRGMETSFSLDVFGFDKLTIKEVAF